MASFSQGRRGKCKERDRAKQKGRAEPISELFSALQGTAAVCQSPIGSVAAATSRSSSYSGGATTHPRPPSDRAVSNDPWADTLVQVDVSSRPIYRDPFRRNSDPAPTVPAPRVSPPCLDSYLTFAAPAITAMADSNRATLVSTAPSHRSPSSSPVAPNEDSSNEMASLEARSTQSSSSSAPAGKRVQRASVGDGRSSVGGVLPPLGKSAPSSPSASRLSVERRRRHGRSPSPMRRRQPLPAATAATAITVVHHPTTVATSLSATMTSSPPLLHFDEVPGEDGVRRRVSRSPSPYRRHTKSETLRPRNILPDDNDDIVRAQLLGGNEVTRSSLQVHSGRKSMVAQPPAVGTAMTRIPQVVIDQHRWSDESPPSRAPLPRVGDDVVIDGMIQSAGPRLSDETGEETELLRKHSVHPDIGMTTMGARARQTRSLCNVSAQATTAVGRKRSMPEGMMSLTHTDDSTSTPPIDDITAAPAPDRPTGHSRNATVVTATDTADESSLKKVSLNAAHDTATIGMATGRDSTTTKDHATGCEDGQWSEEAAEVLAFSVNESRVSPSYMSQHLVDGRTSAMTSPQMQATSDSSDDEIIAASEPLSAESVLEVAVVPPGSVAGKTAVVAAEQPWEMIEMIDPDDSFYCTWLGVVTVAVFYNIWMVLMRITFSELRGDVYTDGLFFTLDLITDAIFLVDIIVHFHITYLEDGIKVMDRQKLSNNYMLRGSFFYDIIALFPVHLLVFLLTDRVSYLYARMLNHIKLHVAFKFFDMVDGRTSYINAFRAVKMAAMITTAIHSTACLYYMVSEYEGFGSTTWTYPTLEGEDSFLARKYIRCVYWSMMTLTTIGENTDPHTNLEYVFTGALFLVGVMIFAAVVGNVNDVIANTNAARADFQSRIDSIKQYMHHRSVPELLQHRVKRWFNYSWSRTQALDEATLLGMLPDSLRAEIAVHIHMDTLSKVEIFQNFETHVLKELVLKLRSQIFSPGDYIIRQGDVGREMFIIKHGKVKIFAGGKFIRTLCEGSVLGEIALLGLGTEGDVKLPGGKVVCKRTADAMSVGYSEVFILGKRDLMAALSEYPEARNALEAQAKERQAQTQRGASTEPPSPSEPSTMSPGESQAMVDDLVHNEMPGNGDGGGLIELNQLMQALKEFDSRRTQTLVEELEDERDELYGMLDDADEEVQRLVDRVAELEERLASDGHDVTAHNHESSPTSESEYQPSSSPSTSGQSSDARQQSSTDGSPLEPGEGTAAGGNRSPGSETNDSDLGPGPLPSIRRSSFARRSVSQETNDSGYAADPSRSSRVSIPRMDSFDHGDGGEVNSIIATDGAEPAVASSDDDVIDAGSAVRAPSLASSSPVSGARRVVIDGGGGEREAEREIGGGTERHCTRRSATVSVPEVSPASVATTNVASPLEQQQQQQQQQQQPGAFKRVSSSGEIEVPRFLRTSVSGESPLVAAAMAGIEGEVSHRQASSPPSPGSHSPLGILPEGLVDQLAARMEAVVQKEIGAMKKWWKEGTAASANASKDVVGGGAKTSVGTIGRRRSIPPGLTRSKTIDIPGVGATVAKGKVTRSSSAPSAGSLLGCGGVRSPFSLHTAVTMQNTVAKGAHNWRTRAARAAHRTRSGSIDLASVNEEGGKGGITLVQATATQQPTKGDDVFRDSDNSSGSSGDSSDDDE